MAARQKVRITARDASTCWVNVVRSERSFNRMDAANPLVKSLDAEEKGAFRELTRLSEAEVGQREKSEASEKEMLSDGRCSPWNWASVLVLATWLIAKQ